MRHTDTLLRHPAPSIAAQEAEDAKAKRVRLDAMAARAYVLQGLAQTEGWALFVEACRNEELAILAILERSADPTTLAKVAGSLLVVRSFQTWAQDSAQELLQAVKDAAEDE